MLTMAMPARKQEYQTTTVRMPKVVYEEAKTIVQRREEVSSVNEFIVEAVKDKLREISEAEIDAAFVLMASDPDYTRDAIAMTREFEKSDWDAFQVGQKTVVKDEHTNHKTHASHSRSR
jgi:hypothetical protein